MSAKWELDPETGTFTKRLVSRSLPDGTFPSRTPEYRRLYHQAKYRDDEEYRAKIRERERQRTRERLNIPTPTTEPRACEICGAETSGVTKTGDPRRLAADHDHATGSFRGWLCSGCNFGIGFLQDDPVILRKAITYLRAHATSHKRFVEEA